MNNPTFWLGFFAGATALTVILLVWLWRIRLTSTAEESREHMKATERLLTERNNIDRDIASALKSLADKHGT